MKPSISLRSLPHVLAGLGLASLTLCLSQCGESGGIHEDSGAPTLVCNPARQATCGSSSECEDLALKPTCSVANAECSSGVCDYHPLGGPGCPCMQFATRPCTKADNSPGTQICGRLTDETTDWCDCE